MSEEAPAETIYVNTTDDRRDKVVMSEKVQSLAGSLYKEFEKVIKKYDEDVVKDLMPLVIGVLEALDASFAEKQDLDVELELVREDNEQLLTQYEREKQLRKTIEQKFLELEDNIEGQKSELEEKVETLESLVRMSEIKYKNATDHVTRLEDKEQDLKNEYNKLHERYTELLRTHMENLEQRKVLLGTDRPLDLNLPSSKIIMKSSAGLQTGSVDSYSHHLGLSSRNEVVHQNYSVATSLPGAASKFPNLKTELYAQNAREGDREQLTESINLSEIVATTKLNQTLADIIASTPELAESQESHRSQGGLHQENSVHNETSMFDEIRATDIAEVDFASGISDSDKEEEEEDDESKDMDRDSVGDNFYGMCRELENLIQENTELLATKNALNIVKDDLIGQIDVLASEQDLLREEIVILTSVRKKQQERISQLEEEVRRLKEEMNKDKENKNSPTEKEETEDDVPMAQRKRFTRVEMARVLMERNQYKERLMELQEAVRWTEMMRANKEHPGELQTRKKSGVWNLFGSLFSSSNKPKPNPVVVTTMRPSTSTSNGQFSGGDASRNQRPSISSSASLEFFQDDINNEEAKKERERERKEQYKKVRALVKKDDGRMQAYGWSLPAKLTASMKDNSEKFQLPVPVPVYCKPLFDTQTRLKIWCAAGVNLTCDLSGEDNKDRALNSGSSVEGRSVPSDSSEVRLTAQSDSSEVGLEVSSDTSELGLHLQLDSTKVRLGTEDSIDKELKASGEVCPDKSGSPQLSSLVWICTSNGDSSQVSVLDAVNPAEKLQTFTISLTHVLSIASIPGVLKTNIPLPHETAKLTTTKEETIAGSSSVFDSSLTEETSSPQKTDSVPDKSSGASDQPLDSSSHTSIADGSNELSELKESKSESSSVSSTSSSLSANSRKLSSAYPTMWMGTHSGSIYIHSAVSSWHVCLQSLHLRDSVLGIVYVKGKVLASLADGTVVIFSRRPDKEWDLENYHLIELATSKQSIRCMTDVAGSSVWCGSKNKIYIICPKSLTLVKTFDAHPRKESQVRQLCWRGDGVWVSIRLDSTLRLYHAHTQQHLQDVDVEPYVSKMLGTGKLGFSFVRITAMLISCNRLWIGTGNGVIISVPLSESNKQPLIASATSLDNSPGSRPGSVVRVLDSPLGSRPGGVVRVYSDSQLDKTSPDSFIPYCSMAQAQLSFHGHKDAVKFFVAVPESGRRRQSGQRRTSSTASETPLLSPTNSVKREINTASQPASWLILSGGEGYVDFRQGLNEDGDSTPTPASTSEPTQEDGIEQGTEASQFDSSHIIIWQVTT